MQKLISIDLKASFGFLKKPDINEGIYLTYNMLHKPAVLGIFGAIAGLEGYAIVGKMEPTDVPEYYKQFGELKIGIQPLESARGNFTKNVIRYTNTVGYANEDGTLIVDEQTLVQPQYRVFVLLNESEEKQKLLMERLKSKEAEYIPYLGKNEHQLWWHNDQEWEFKEFQPEKSFIINSIFIKSGKLRKEEFSYSGSYMYFENIPVEFRSDLPQYALDSVVFTDYELEAEEPPDNLYKLSSGEIIQLF